MAKSGKERKGKRGARKAAEAALVNQAGDHWAAGREKEDNALVAQSIRWNTQLTGDDLKINHQKEEDRLNALEVAILITRRGMLNPDMAIANSAVNNLIKMEAQNQRDDLGEEQGLQASIQQSQIVLSVPDNGRGPQTKDE